MNSKENSTGRAGEATVSCSLRVGAIEDMEDIIDGTGGLIGKVVDNRHLSSILLRWLEEKIGPNAGRPGRVVGSRDITIHNHQWDELLWLAGEVAMNCHHVDDLVSSLDVHVTEICNATYDARKAVAN